MEPSNRINKIFGCSSLSGIETIRIIYPFIIERILTVIIGMVDTAFLSSSDPVLIEATGLTSTLLMFLMQVPFAICVGGAVLAAQYRGREDYKSIRESMGQTFSLAVVSSVVLFVIVLFFGKGVLTLLYPSVEADLMDASFKLLVGNTASLIVYAAAQPMVATLSALGDGKGWSFVSVTAGIIGVVGTWFFVYVADLGIFGPVVSLLVHRVFKLAVAFFLIKKNHPELRVKISSFIYWDGEKAGKIFKVALPVCLEYLFINMASIIHSSIIGGLGRVAVRANAIFASVGSFAEIFFLSLPEAVTAIVGRCVGAGNKKDARKMSFQITTIALVLSVAAALVYLPFSEKVLLAFYNPSEEIIKMAPLYITVFVIGRITLFSMSEISCAAVRASGDTAFVSKASLIANFCVSVPLAYIFANVLEMGLMGPWLATFIYWAIRAAAFNCRILSKKWCHKRLV
jgi:putative MATE family efflux protein